MLRTAVLLHTLPDGSAHFDWVLQTPDREGLATYRTDANPAESRGFAAERLPDHRAIYLDYQGPVSGDRGHVRRVAAGVCRAFDPDAASLRIACDFGEGWVEYEGRRCGEGWRFERVS